jgi:pyrimidine-nucleoside phosphorylase
VIDAREFLREKRDGHTHAPEAVREFIAAYLRREVPDYQVSAWLMAAFLRGLDSAETDALTHALLHSGRVFDFSQLGVAADKHSTGGVGDKMSLILAPIVAACGVPVPMVSGRGLGHTGGTLDKLESIPGFRTTLTPEAMAKQLETLGILMVGQGPDLAPADGLLYALRDVTSTVEFEPFIVSSIVSKKIAEGARAIVYDVKCGKGAFMKTQETARSLAKRLVTTSRALGAQASAFLTDMDWPIGETIGNALEVQESWELLNSRGPQDSRLLTLTLAAEMVRLAGAEPDTLSALARVTQVLDSGAAREKFLAMVQAQGGDASVLLQAKPLHRAPVVVQVQATREGYLRECDCFALGELVVHIGGGRRAKEDAIDPRVGVRMLLPRGARVKAGQSYAEIHLAAADGAAVARLAGCFVIGDAPPVLPAPDLVIERVG